MSSKQAPPLLLSSAREMDGTALITPCSALSAWLQAALNIYTTWSHAHNKHEPIIEKISFSVFSFFTFQLPPSAQGSPHTTTSRCHLGLIQWDATMSWGFRQLALLFLHHLRAPTCRYLKSGVSSACSGSGFQLSHQKFLPERPGGRPGYISTLSCGWYQASSQAAL